MTTIGVVGGVGPVACAHFYQRLLALSPATADEDYPAVALVAEQVPDRVGHLLHGGRDPLPALLDAVRRLELAGADVIAIPSATTHAYRDALTAACRVPILDLLAEAAAELHHGGHRRPLLLATAATVRLRLYEPHLTAPTALYPDAAAQRDVDRLIHHVKRGGPVEPARAELTRLARRLRTAARADCVVLGCTELSVIAPRSSRPPVVDVTDVLARAALRRTAAPTAGTTNTR